MSGAKQSPTGGTEAPSGETLAEDEDVDDGAGTDDSPDSIPPTWGAGTGEREPAPYDGPQ